MRTTRMLLSAVLSLMMMLSILPAQTEAKPIGEYAETYKMSAYIGTGTIEPQDQPNNEYVKWIKEKFNLDISETQFLTGDRNQALGLMIASGTMPDVITFWTDSEGKKLANQFVEAGMVLEVEDYLRENCPNLMVDLNETFIDAYRAKDGKLYVIPSYGINPENKTAPYTLEPNVTLFKRTDLFNELGIEDPKTPEEFYNALVKLSGTKTSDGSRFIPLQAYDGGVYEMVVGGMFGVWTHRTDINEEEKRFTSIQEFPEYLEFLKYMAKLYREELVDPELFITEQPVAISRQKEGRIGIGITWPNDLDVLTYSLQQAYPDAMYNAIPIPKVEGLESTQYWQTPTLPSMMTLVSKDAKYPERIFEYLDWMVSAEGWLGACYGAPGKGVGCWYEEDGKFYFDQARRDEYMTADPLYENQVLGGWTYFMAGRYIYHIHHHGFANITESPDKQRMEARDYNVSEVFMDPEWELIQAIPAGPIEEVKSIAVGKVLEDGYQKIVMEAQNDEQVEEMYNKMMADAESAGLREIQEEQYARYQMYLNGTLN